MPSSLEPSKDSDNDEGAGLAIANPSMNRQDAGQGPALRGSGNM